MRGDVTKTAATSAREIIKRFLICERNENDHSSNSQKNAFGVMCHLGIAAERPE